MRLRVVTAGVLAGAVLAAGVTVATENGAENAESGDRSAVAAAPPRTPDSRASQGRTPEALSSPDQRRRTAEAVTGAVTAAVPGTTTGLAVYDRDEDSVVVGSEADRPFRTASVVKLLIAIDVLSRHDWRTPDAATARDVTTMLAASDDTAATALWSRHGDVAVVDRAAALLRLSDTTPPDDPEQWELTRMSPTDIVRTYAYVEAHMPRPARDLVLDALDNFAATASDGFDQRFGVPAAFGERTWAVKQGWMPVSGEVVLNTTGVVGSGSRYLVALLAEFPAGTDFGTARAALTSGADRLAAALGTR